MSGAEGRNGAAGRRLHGAGSWALDHPLPVLLAILVAGALFFWLVLAGSGHRVTAVFDSAVSLYPRQPVLVSGERVGSVRSVELKGKRAMVELEIDRHWPLPQGTTAYLRFGSTICQGCRNVQLVPGPRRARTLEEDAVIPEQRTTTPVEVDDVFNTLNSRARADLKGTIVKGAVATRGQSARIRNGIQGTGDTLESTGGLLHDLNLDRPALSALVTQGDGATRTLASREPVIEDLLTVAATTFREFGTRTSAVRASLDGLAPTLRESRTTLARTDATLDNLDGLVSDLRPALTELRPFIAAGRPVPRQLRVLSPLATRTLQVLTSTAPSVTRLLRRGQPFSDQLDGVFGGLAPQLDCIRPYGPEIASFFTQWTSWAQDYDDISHYGRVKGNQGPTSNTATPPVNNAAFLAGSGGGLKQAIPFPPGLSAGKPWFLPECGAGPESLDPSRDPEEETRP